MYTEDFAARFFEYLHEYSDEPEMLNALKHFIEYGWGSVELGGVQTPESAEAQVDFVGWMADNGASMDAIQAAIKLMTEK